MDSFKGLFGIKIRNWAFLLGSFLRLFLLFIPPIFTTDLERSLWYGKLFWKHGFRVYDISPLDIDPTTDLHWANTTFNYGVVQLLFYAIIALISPNFNLGSLMVKIIVTLVDTLNLYLLYRLSTHIYEAKDNLSQPQIFGNTFILKLYWLAFALLSSMEGQMTSITLCFIILPYYCVYIRNNSRIALVLLAIGFHWKYIPVLVIPHLIFLVMLKKQPLEQKTWEFLPAVLVFVLLFFPLIVSSYIFYFLFYNVPASGYRYNDFYLDPSQFSSSTLFSINFAIIILPVLLVMITLYLLYEYLVIARSARHYIFSEVNYLAMITLCIFFLTYKYVLPWYWFWFIPVLIPLKSKNEKQGKRLGLVIKTFYASTLLSFINDINYWVVLLL